MGLNFTRDGLDRFGKRLTRYVEGWLGLEVYGFVGIEKDEEVGDRYYLHITLDGEYIPEDVVGKLNKEFGVEGFRYNDWDKEFVCTVTREGLRKLYTLCKMLGVEVFV